MKNGKPRLLCSLDPGASGCLSALDLDTKQVILLADLPVEFVTINGTRRRRYHLKNLKKLLRGLKTFGRITTLILEKQQPIFRDSPRVAFATGHGFGVIEGMLNCLSIPYQLVLPLTWKTCLGLDADKEKSLVLARKLFPQLHEELKRKMDHSRAEALLLLHYYIEDQAPQPQIDPDDAKMLKVSA